MDYVALGLFAKWTADKQAQNWSLVMVVLVQGRPLPKAATCTRDEWRSRGGLGSPRREIKS